MEGTLDFLAVASAGYNSAASGIAPTVVWGESDNAAKKAVLTVPDNSAKFDDLMYGAANGCSSGTAGSALVLRHAMTSVVFFAKSNVAYDASTNTGITITGITLDGAKFSGTLTVSNPSAGGGSGDLTAAWSSLGDQKDHIAARVWNSANSGVLTNESALSELHLSTTAGSLSTDPFGEAYVILPPQAAVPFTISYTIHNGFASDGTTPVNPSIVDWDSAENAPIVVPEPAGFSFSVSATDKVEFSKGNLQAVFAAPGTSFTWKFADNQWDYVGGDDGSGSVTETGNNFINGNGSVSAAGTVDLFGWSTSATTYGINPSDDPSAYSGAFVDWGSDPNLVSTLGSGWRTLTQGEWEYLLVTRTGDRYCKATVNSVPGLVIFPDDYSHPSGVTSPASVNTSSAAFTSNTWSGDAWTMMESAGCVFLPAEGGRDGTSVYDVGSEGCFYWSSTPTGTDLPYLLYFTSSNVDPSFNYYPNLGGSVRLVKNL